MFQLKINNNFFSSLIIICFGYYAFRLCFFALSIPHHFAPDEIVHVGICKVFSQVWWLPKNTGENYSLGNVVDVPWLYYFVMGKLLHFKVVPVSDLLYLRLLNCALSLTMVIFSFRWISLLTNNNFTRFLFLVLITNTPMFTFLGACVNYDNLLNLLSILTLFYLHRFFNTHSLSCFFLSGIFLFASPLTKITSLPLVIIFIGIFLYYVLWNRESALSFIKNENIHLTNKNGWLAVFFLVLCFLNFSLYGGNLLKYKKLVPEAGDVFSQEQIMQNIVSTRDLVFSNYRSGKWEKKEVIEEAVKSNNPEPFLAALSLIDNYERNKDKPQLSLYFGYPLVWLDLMIHRSVGIFSHESISKSSFVVAIYKLILIFSFIVLALNWRKEKPGFLMNQSIILVFIYSLFLMLYVNYYGYYLKSLAPGWSIQGRYFFPVLAPFYGVVSYYLTNSFKNFATLLVVMLVAVFFIWGDFPHLLFHSDYHSWSEKLNSVDNVSRNNKSQLDVVIGDFYKSEKNDTKALMHYKRSIQIDPSNTLSYYKLGRFYLENGSLSMALEHYQSALKLEPENAGYHYLLGQVYQEAGFLDKAISQFETAILLNPEIGASRRFFGDLYAKNRQWDKAIEQYLAAIKLEPENSGFHYLLGSVYQQAGSLDNAKEQFETAIRLEPANGWYHRFLGQLDELNGQPKMALEQYQQAVRLDSENASFHYLLGTLYQKMNLSDKALEQYKELIRLAPENIQYQNLVKQFDEDRASKVR